MTESTIGDLTAATPIDGIAEIGQQGRLLMSDLSITRVMFQLQGQIEDMPKGIQEELPALPGHVLNSSETISACLRPDLFLLISKPQSASFLNHKFQTQDQLRVTLTDITHGRALLCLSGQLVSSLLPKLCSLNFYPEIFHNLHAAPTSYAKVHVVIIRCDLDMNVPTYYLVAGRSYGQYVWRATMDAMQEFVEIQ